MQTVSENLRVIRQQIVHCKPTIIAVTKYFDESKLIEAYDAGIRDFGENRVIDALNKFEKLPEKIRKNSCFHLIGQLQSNKVKKAVGNFDYIHSVDSLKLACLINEEAKKLGIIQKVFIQVNNSGERQKSGMSEKEIEDIFGDLLNFKSIEIVGLMNIAPLTKDENLLNELFGRIKFLKRKLEIKFNYQIKELSMGMSNDYEIAIKNGATMIRLGRKLFTGNI